MAISGSFNIKNLDGIYSKKKIAGNDIVVTPSLNSPIREFYHSSKNENYIQGFYNEGNEGKHWNEITYDDLSSCIILGQDDVLDKRANKKDGGYFADLLNELNTSINTNYYNLNRDYLEVFPIRAKAIGQDDIFFPNPPRGIFAKSIDGIPGDTYIVFSYVDADYYGTPVLKGFYDDSAFTMDTGSYARKSFLTKSYSSSGKVSLVGFYNETDNKFVVSTGSLTHPVLFSGSYVNANGTINKSLVQMAISAFSSSKPTPYAQVNMRTVGDFIGINETEILNIRNNWHFVSSGSRNSGDKNIVSTSCSKQIWTSANSPTNSDVMASSQQDLLPPIRRAYEYDLRDSTNVKNNVKFVLTSSAGEDDYYVSHINYKEMGCDQTSFNVGVDSLTTNIDEQLISVAINEPIGDELYERNTHKFLETFKTLRFRVSSSLTPNVVNEFQVGVHPLQIVRPHSMVKFPQGSNVSFIDDVALPIDPFGIQNIEPLKGYDFFEPGRKQLPRIFVPEHYITGAIGGATASSDMTTYNPEWAADPEGGRVWSHWQQHSTSIGAVNVIANISELYTTSSFFGQPNASSDLKAGSFSNEMFKRGIRPIIKSLSEFNDYFQRGNEKYSIAHKQTFNVLSGSGNGLRSVGVKFAGIHAAYPFSASLVFYSCSDGVVVDSIKLGPYFSTSSFIARNTVGTFSSLPGDMAGNYCLLPSGLDRNNSSKPDPEGADFNFSWHSSSVWYTEDAFGYINPASLGVLVDSFSKYGLSTASIKTEAVLFHEIISNESFPDIDLNLYNTSSVVIDFLTTFENKNFLKYSSDRSTNIIGYNNLYNELEQRSNFDALGIPFRSNMAHYCIGYTGSIPGDIVTTTGSVAFAFLMSKNRGESNGFSDNYGDVRNFPNAMVVPGTRPFREDKSLFVSKSYDLTKGTIYWANKNVDTETQSQKLFFIGNDNLDLAKLEKVDPDYCRSLYASNYNSSDKNIFGIGLEGSYGFKNYIRNEGVEHNQVIYDAMLATLGRDQPSWFGDGQTKTFYYCTDFYGLTKDDLLLLYNSYRDNVVDFKDIFVHSSSVAQNNKRLAVDRRIPPDYLSNMSHTIYLQYPKSYATASSGIAAVTYSFVRNGPSTISNYGRLSLENVADFNNTSFLFTLMSESSDAKTELATNNKDVITFNNKDSNFIFVQDSSSIGTALEVGTSAHMPNETSNNLLTNSYGDFIVRASLTDKRKWTFASLSSSIDDPTVAHGDGAGTKFKFYAPNAYKLNNAQIGIACSSSVVSQFGSDISTDNGYASSSGTMGYFSDKLGPNIDFSSIGTLHRRVIENSSIDFSLLNTFNWIAEPTMVSSQINCWSGTARIVASSSRQEITGTTGNVYPINNNSRDRIKSDAFVNLPVINASFANLQPYNIVASPGRAGGSVNSTKGEHYSASVVYGGTGSMIFGVKTLNQSSVFEPATIYMRRFSVEQYQKTQPGYGDDNYIRRVNQKILHDLGVRVLTESYSNPEFPVISDSSYMSRKDGGLYNYVVYNKEEVFKDSKSIGSSVRSSAISGVTKYAKYASSSMFYQKNNRVTFFNTNFGQYRHLMEQSLGGRVFGGFKDYFVYYTSSIGVVEPTGSLPLSDI